IAEIESAASLDPKMLEETPIVVLVAGGRPTLAFDASGLRAMFGSSWPKVQALLESPDPARSADELRVLADRGALVREAIGPLAEAEALLLERENDPRARAMISLVLIQARLAAVASL